MKIFLSTMKNLNSRLQLGMYPAVVRRYRRRAEAICHGTL